MLSTVGLVASLGCMGASIYYINRIEKKNSVSQIKNVIFPIVSNIGSQLGITIHLTIKVLPR